MGFNSAFKGLNIAVNLSDANFKYPRCNARLQRHADNGNTIRARAPVVLQPAIIFDAMSNKESI